MTLTIDRATHEELPIVLGLLNAAREWLHSRDVDQWPTEFTADRIGTDAVDMFIVREGQRPVGCIRISGEADRVFWTSTEARELAMYVSRMAVAEHGRGLGELMWSWAVDYAAQLGYRFVRLDCRRDNAKLRGYYASRGWDYVRTVEAPGRFSGALFERPALPDPAARAAMPPSPAPGGWLDPAARVVVEGEGAGVVIAADPGFRVDSDGPVRGCDDSSDGYRPGYIVKLDTGQQVTVERSKVTAANGLPEHV